MVCKIQIFSHKIPITGNAVAETLSVYIFKYICAEMKRITTYLLLMTMVFCTLRAENRQLNVLNGLSENTVRCIIQDHTGYIWFGTKDGLNRYNGIEFKVYGSSSESGRIPGVSPLNIENLLLHKDGKRIWVAARQSLYLFDPGTEDFIKISAENDKGEVISLNSCFSVCYDTEGRLWVGTGHGLYLREDKDGSCHWTEFRNEPGNELSLPSDRVNKVFCDSRGVMWIGTEGGLARYDSGFGEFRRVSDSGNGQEIILSISEDNAKNIWVGTWYNGFAKVVIGKNRLEYIGRNQVAGMERVRDIYQCPDGKMMLCSDNGLYLYDKDTGICALSDIITSDSSAATKGYYSFFEDKEGGYWIGTYFNGVYYVSPKSRVIGTVRPDKNCAVSQFCESENGNIYVATETHGLYIYNPHTKTVSKPSFSEVGHNIHSLAIDGDRLWIGTFAEGLVCADLKTGQIRRFRAEDGNSIPNNHVYSLHMDNSGNLYVGTMRGACVMSAATGEFANINELSDKFVYDIAEKANGDIWFGLYGSGVMSYSPGSGVWKDYSQDNIDGPSVCSSQVIRLFVDSKDNMWVCTEGAGICRYDESSDSFVKPHVNSGDGELPNTIVFGMLEDIYGTMWLSTNGGLVRFNYLTGEYSTLTYSDGMQNNQFNYRSSYLSSDGKFYFGGIDGFNVFIPQDIVENKVVPEMAVSLVFHDGNQQIRQVLEKNAEVSVPRNIRAFSLTLECLSFVAPDDNYFKYRFGDSGEWISISGHEIPFINMESGRYVLNIRAVNGDGYESGEYRIRLRVKPHILISGVAIVLYCLAALVLAFLLISGKIRRQKKEMERRLEEARLKSEQQTYDAKIQFFTQIAHEIKTPISLIKAPLEIIRRERQWNESTEKNLDLISRNTDRLMLLIRQLLDFKKINNEGYRLKVELVNVNVVVNDIVDRFPVSVMNGGVAVTADKSLPLIKCVMDPDALTKILTNLISNAVKFARSEVSVSFGRKTSADGEFVVFSVSDDGPGIDLKDREKIFDAFYQASSYDRLSKSEGVGLGLSLVKLLVEKHNGKVYVSDTYQDGCEFVVEIPYIQVSDTD